MFASSDRPRSHARGVVAAILLGLACTGPAWAVDYCQLIDPNGCDGAPEYDADLLTIDGITYDLRSGKFRAREVRIADFAQGGVVQTGGLNTITELLSVGTSGRASGSYLLAGGALFSQSTSVGHSSRPSTFVQSAGTHTVVEMFVAQRSGMQLQGGLFTAGLMRLQGGFTQTGGSATVSGSVSMLGGASQYTQTGGSGFIAGNMSFRGGELSVSAGSLRVDGKVSLGQADAVLSGGQLQLRQPMEITDSSARLTLQGGSVLGDVTVTSLASFWSRGGSISGRLQLVATDAVDVDPGTTRLGELTLQAVRSFALRGSLVTGLLGMDSFSSLILEGGSLQVDGDFASDGLLGGFGTVGGRSQLTGRGNLAAGGGTLRLATTGGASLDGTVFLAPDGTLELASPLESRGMVQVSGRSIRGSGELQIAAGGRLTGPGVVATPLSNRGRIEVVGGTLALQRDFTSHGTIDVTTGSRLEVRRIVNLGRIDLAGTLAGDVLNQGTVDLQGGRWVGRLTQAAGATLQLARGVAELDQLDLQPGAVITLDAGAEARVGGALRLGDGAQQAGAGRLLARGAIELGGSGYGLFTSAGELQLAPDGVLAIDLGGTDELLQDRVSASFLNLAQGTLRLRLAPGYRPQAGDRFDLFDMQRLGAPASIDLAAAPLAPDLSWDWSQLAATGEVRVLAVPEPGAWALLLAGLAVLGLRRRSAPCMR